MKCQWEDCSLEIENGDIKAHMQMHILESPDYSCKWESCSRKNVFLSNKYAYQSHVNLHIGEKPYRCESCEKAFSRADALNKHIKRHEAEEKILVDKLKLYFYMTVERDNLCHQTDVLLEKRTYLRSILNVLKLELNDIESSNQKYPMENWDDYIN